MRKVLLYSILLLVGLFGSQLSFIAGAHWRHPLMMTALAFIMIHVGLEFEIDKSKLAVYGKDAAIATAAASLPWVFCTIYFVFVLSPHGWHESKAWNEALLEGLFSAPTSAGVLFSMLAAAGLHATWVFSKARVLAVFDDLSTLLLLIPLKIALMGFQWQLIVVVAFMVMLIFIAWKYLHHFILPVKWRFVLAYAVLVTAFCIAVEYFSRRTITIEVLLPAFVFGCVIRQSRGHDTHDESSHHLTERRASTIISAIFMLLVGLSMPKISLQSSAGGQSIGWSIVLLHVLAITFLSNLGKMLPAFCYKKDAPAKHRIALAVSMFPRGEVGAGVLVIAVNYGIANTALTVAVLSLALNLVCTGLFILVVKKLLKPAV